MKWSYSAANIAMDGVDRAYFVLRMVWVELGKVSIFRSTHNEHLPVFISSVQRPPLRRIRLTELTDGMVFGSHIRCDNS